MTTVHEIISDTSLKSDAEPINESQFQFLKSKLRGKIILPTDSTYDEARKVYNAMIDKRPLLLAYPVDVADIITLVNFARENKLLLAVQGGGHSGSGLGTCDNGLVINLSSMKSVWVDPKRRIARVEGGATWGDFDHAAHAFGLATPGGFLSTTGVGGLTLGGGIGYLNRKYGLAIDNLLSADLVLASGEFVTASAEENQDLFWAIRGGGGNFGIVTSFTFKLHPVKNIIGGPVLWPLDQAPLVLRFYRDFITTAPEEVGAFFAFMQVPPAPAFPQELHNQKVCGVVFCYLGSEEESKKIFEPFLKVGNVCLNHIGAMPYPALQSAFDALYPKGLQWYWRTSFCTDLSDEAIEQHLKYAEVPTMHSTMHIYPLNGAVQRFGAKDTPWPSRNCNFAVTIVGVDPSAENAGTITKWAKNYGDALQPFSSAGAYVNMMMYEGEERVKNAYGESYDQLAAVKSIYDPDNLFKVNQNIKPSSKSMGVA